MNAEHLLAHSLGKKRIELYLEFERPLAEEELAPLRELVRRRGSGEPLQHLLGTVEFCGRVFKCDQRALVPRPETEELVQFILQATLYHHPSTILDVGTGSGVIALSLAPKFLATQVHAVDISDEALALARENAERLGLSGRVQFTKNDLLENLSERFDLIAANLPYVSMQDRQSLSREVLRNPEIALFGGDQGDELIRRLIEQAQEHLQRNGLLALEIGIGQREALSKLVAEKLPRHRVKKRLCRSPRRFLFARYG